MLNAIRTDLKKNILSGGFLLGVGALLLLILLSDCVVYDGSGTMPSYSYLQFVFKTERSLWLSEILYSDIHMFIRGFGNEWLAVFLPMLTGIACVPMLCDELNSNNFRLCVIRRGRGQYIASKLISAALTAMLMVTAAAVMFGLFCLIVFPSPKQCLAASGAEGRHLEYLRRLVSFEEYPLNALFSSHSRCLVALSRLLTLWLYAVLPCILAMLLGAVTANKFVSMSLPVMGYFGIRQIAISVIENSFKNGGKYPKLWFFDVRSRYSQGETMFSDIMGLPVWTFYLYPIIACVLLGLLFAKVMKRRVSV